MNTRRGFLGGLLAAMPIAGLLVYKPAARADVPKARGDTRNTVRQKRFVNETVDVEGVVFVGCTFVNCLFNGKAISVIKCVFVRNRSYVRLREGGVAAECFVESGAGFEFGEH